MESYCIRSTHKQQGMATLLVAIVLLISITLVVLVSAQSVVTQQRIIANEQRATQAFEAAYAGLDYGMSYFQANTADDNDDDALDSLLAGNSWTYFSGTSGPSYRVKFVDDVDPGNLKIVSLVAEGRSDDQSAISSMAMTVSGTPALADAPGNPVTARGFINMSGSGTITNLEGATTVWTGEVIDFSAMSTNTIVKHPSAAGGIESSSASNKGPDVVDNDANLSTLNDTQYFQNFFGLTEANYKGSVAGLEVDPDVTSMSTLDGENGKVIWVDGDAAFTGTPVIGTADEPVVLIIDGNMSGAGNVTVNGLLFVTGNFSGTGSLDVNGAVVIRGDMSGTGSMDAFFDSDVLDNLGDAGRGAGVPGTWTDFDVTW